MSINNEHSYERLCDRYTKRMMFYDLVNLTNVYCSCVLDFYFIKIENRNNKGSLISTDIYKIHVDDKIKTSDPDVLKQIKKYK